MGGVTPPPNFKKSGKFGQNKGKFGQNNGKFCHKWQHLWLLVHPIKFGQFYKSRIFGRFNEHTPPNQSGFATPLDRGTDGLLNVGWGINFFTVFQLLDILLGLQNY